MKRGLKFLLALGFAMMSLAGQIPTAAAKGGLGVWTADYSLGDINLAVPAGQMGGVYTSTLTWQLSDTPQ